MKFEQANRNQLRYDLLSAGWSIDRKAKPTVADQLHRFHGPKSRQNRTLRNAAIIEGLVTR